MESWDLETERGQTRDLKIKSGRQGNTRNKRLGYRLPET
jgi:hypothetical protein